MLISAPKPTAWITFPKTRKGLEHFPSRIGFEHDLRGLHRVPLRDVDQKVNMVEGKAKVTELKPKAFQIIECLDTGVDIEFFSKTVISVVGDKHHRHPVIAGVTRNLFRATAMYNIHEFSPVASLKKQATACCTRQKKNHLSGEKRDATFHLRVFHFVSDHAVFSVATINKKISKEN
jgi:hypothetical protein